MKRQRVYSGAPWEEQVGYCRAIRAGDHIYVTGTVSVDDHGQPYGVGDGYAQARRCLEIIEAALIRLGGSRGQVVRTRMYVTDISRWSDYGRAHSEFFGDDRPATTMVEVQKLINESFEVEIEVDAVVDHL